MVDGWLPGKTLYGTSASGTPAARTSSAVWPKASAADWARQLASSGIMVAGQRKIALAQGDEVAGDGPPALMDQLIERVLAIGAGFAPEHRAGGDADRLAVAVDLLAVAFHFQLLQIGRQQGQRLAVGQDGRG